MWSSRACSCSAARASTAKASPSPAWCRRATSWRCAPSRPGSRCAATTRSSAWRGWTSRRASMCTATTWSSATSRATTPWARASRPRHTWPSRPPSRASCAPDGRVATRNYIGVLTSVNCSATVARAIADHFRRDIHPRGAGSAIPNVDGVVALTHGAGCATDSEGEPLQILRRTLGGYARHANFGALLMVGLGCETNQISGLMQQEGLQESSRLHTFNIQDTGGTRKTVARRHRVGGVDARRSQPREAPAGAGQPHHRRPAMRRLRWLLRHQRQPGAGRGGRPAGAPWRHGHPVRIARGLRRRTPADAPRRVARGGRQAARAHALVGGLLRAQRRRDGQQPLGRQQGRRPDHHPRKVPGRGGQERHHQPGRRVRVRPAGHGQGLGVHGHAGLRPGVGHRPGGRWRQPDLLHHRPRLGLRLRAVAVAQAVHQHARCG